MMVERFNLINRKDEEKNRKKNSINIIENSIQIKYHYLCKQSNINFL
jgi:hypothetical protein